MNKKRISFCFVLGFFVFLAFTSGAVAGQNQTQDQDGVITGKVVLKDGDPAEDVKIELRSALDPTATFNLVNTTRTGKEGNYSFVGLNASNFYKVSAIYGNNSFQPPTGYGFIYFTENQTHINANITVFEGTKSTEDIVVSLRHVRVSLQSQADSLLVKQILLVNNTGEEPFIGELKIDLGKKLDSYNVSSSKNVSFEILPNQSSYTTLQYRVPFNKTYTLSLDVNYPTDRLFYLIENSSLTASNTENLMSFGIQQMGGTEYMIYYAGVNQKIEPGTQLSLQIKPLQEQEPVNEDQNQLQSLLIPIALISALAVTAIAYIKRDRISSYLSKTGEQNSGKEETEVEEETKSLKEQKEEVLSKIEELDEKHEKDEISEEEYKNKREEYKKKAMDLIKRIEEQRDTRNRR
ncbi:MAG: putative membrane-associated trancriptional regulator [Candidatus Methanohalarchaeum thermophilum]|uniref:Membrane-associated trancriptional regulator n=1 Tax=Methanohalarchaeum thermophilum TaxID=1903181 RepID=A0A1Q6DSM8_METT1|nr:MAG: putative membrane-associated trancriptional regulator [Candidatus Methanohalarchaeum thermophilum]